MSTKTLCVAFFLVIITCDLGGGYEHEYDLRCYNFKCSESGEFGTQCPVDDPQTTHWDDTVICAPNELCIKHVSAPHLINNVQVPSIVTRKCGTMQYCEDVKEISKICVGCQEDMCNSGSVIIPSMTVIIMFAIHIVNYF